MSDPVLAVRLALLSPICAATLAVLIWSLTKAVGVPRPPFTHLAILSTGAGVIGAGLTFAYTFASMIWYTWSTGYDAGNAPLAWIFFFGPIGFACGQLVALLAWCVNRPRGFVAALIQRIGFSR